MRALCIIIDVVLVALAGCAEPDFADCTVSCNANSDCPSGYTCGAGYCSRASNQCNAAVADAGDDNSQPDHDGAMPGDDGGMKGDGGAGGFAFSNGLGQQYLEGVTGALVAQGGTPITIDTDTGEILQDTFVIRHAGMGVKDGIFFGPHPGGTGSILAVASAELGVHVEVIGDRALHIISAGDVHLTGVIDVAGGCTIGTELVKYCGGPGGGDGVTDTGPPSFCGSGDSGDGGNGGGGGGHGQPGAGGVLTDCSDVEGGMICGTASLEPLTGGGGGGAAEDSHAFGGGGGGAIQIASYTIIEIGEPRDGAAADGINAGGAGGEGGFQGGGGGGEGGAILLEAPAITLHDNAVLAANGGGGGCGRGSEPGGGGDLAGFGIGGCLSTDGEGGHGGDLATPTQGTCLGGHGGGAGRIRINTSAGGLDDLGATISPTPSLDTTR